MADSIALAVLVAGAALVHFPAAQAQGYPVRPVRVVVPSAPGGGSDLTARLLAPRIAEHLRQQVVIDNRPGAGTAIGAEHVARAAPDGYTLLLGSTALVTTAATRRKLPFDVLRDFSPITEHAAMPNLLIAHPSLPVKSVGDLVTLARARPGQLTFASAGVGTNPHLTMELFLGMTRLKMVHVPYKGAGPGVSDLIAGHVSLMTPSIISVLGHVRSGRLRALGVTGARRASGAPEIPTVAEQGVPGYDSAQWFGYLAPAGVPREIVALLHGSIVRALQQTELKSRLVADGAEPVGSTPEEFAEHIRVEMVKWAKVVKDAGIPVE